MNFSKMNSHFFKWIINLWPCIRGTGGKITYISKDFSELIVKLPLSLRTRNAVGTIFGGSMYASTDPFYMLMLMRILGPEYVVWDKGCTIRFKKPAKKTLYAKFHITPEMLSEVKAKVGAEGKATFTWSIAFKDADGTIYSEFDKVLYVATKEFYQARQSTNG